MRIGTPRSSISISTAMMMVIIYTATRGSLRRVHIRMAIDTSTSVTRIRTGTISIIGILTGPAIARSHGYRE